MTQQSNKSYPAEFFGKKPGAAGLPDANPEDVATIESIIRASYETLSGPAGQPRDWDRQRTLFLPEAHSIRTGKLPDGSVACRVMTTSEYIAQINDWLVQNGFFEREIHRVVEQFGNIAHVFSTYESHRNADDPQPFMRGINSFQLLSDGRRWWIVNIMWQHESPEYPIPSKYLP
jgi:hypothetical protein